MKIAYLANIRFPSERAQSVQIAHMCQAFSTVGIDLTLFVNKRVSSDFEKQYGFQPSYSVKRIRPKHIYPSLKFTFYTGELLFSLLFLLTQQPKKFDVIYSRSEWVLYFLSFFINVKKLVWESHEAKLSLPAKYILKRGMACVCISDGIKNVYTETLGLPASQFLLAHDGIDDSFFEVGETKDVSRTRLGITETKPVAGYIGGFDAWKGIETFFAASEQTEDIQFVAIGGKTDEIARYKKRYPRVQFLGQRPYKELRDNQVAMDVLVIPNTATNELASSFTSPLKLFAHMTSGVPLVVSDVPSLTSVTGKESVYTFVADNPQSLAGTLKLVVNGREQAQQKAKELQTLSHNYTWKKRAEDIKSFIS